MILYRNYNYMFFATIVTGNQRKEECFIYVPSLALFEILKTHLYKYT